MGVPSLQEMFGRSSQSRLFSGGHGFQRTAVMVCAPVANFNEYEAVILKHDEVQFTDRAAIVCFNEFKSPSLQPPAGNMLTGKAPH